MKDLKYIFYVKLVYIYHPIVFEYESYYLAVVHFCENIYEKCHAKQLIIIMQVNKGLLIKVFRYQNTCW